MAAAGVSPGERLYKAVFMLPSGEGEVGLQHRAHQLVLLLKLFLKSWSDDQPAAGQLSAVR